MEVIVEKKQPAKKAGEILTKFLKESKTKPTLLMLSGGSAFDMLEYVPDSVLGPHVSVAVLDERYDPDPDINNFGLLARTSFYKKAEKKKCKFIHVDPGDDKGLLDYADKVETRLRMWEQNNLTGVIIATMGIGKDGHTAGILPLANQRRTFDSLFEKSKWKGADTEDEESSFLFDDGLRWVAGYDAEGKSKYPLRVTATNAFLRESVDHAVVYVAGEGKRAALEKAMAPEGKLHLTPARIIHTMKDVVLVTDLPGIDSPQSDEENPDTM